MKAPQQQGNGPTLNPTNTKLTTYSEDVLKTVGIITSNIEYQNQQCQLPLVIVDTPVPTLLG